MAKHFLDSAGLATFFAQLKGLFATSEEVTAVTDATDVYILNIDYENTLAFDTKEIVIGENDDIVNDDITLEENESLLSTTSDEILVNINDEYIIIEKGE